MNMMLGSTGRHHITKVILSLLVVVLIVGMTGCAVGSDRPLRYDLTIASGEGGWVDIPGERTFTCDAGRVVDLVAIPASGYRFVKWTGSVDMIASVYAASTTITMNDDYSITADFEETDGIYYTLTTSVSPSGGGSVGPAGGTYAAGSQVTLTAMPASGYSFSHWGGDASGSQNSITITMNSNKSITAYFVQTGVTYTLTTNVSPSGGGSVSPPGGTYPSGSQVTLTATPASGYSFSHWGGDASGSQNSITIIMNSNKSITAYFVQTGVTYTLTTNVSPSGGGSVSPPGGTYPSGSQVTLTATPASGYSFSHWGGDASGSQNSITITMNSNKSITAYFEEAPPIPPDQYSLTMAASPITGGTVSDLTGTSPYTQGESVSIQAVAASGYQFTGWTAAAGSFANANAPTTTFTMPGQDVTVTAHFEQTGVTFMVSAGERHTVGLKSNGTVLAVGNNEHGQRDVGDWTNIIQVAAGGYHTVGLRSDGTVLAEGYNYYGQCDVSSWTNIIQIAAGSYHTVGLREDGTVLAVGYKYWWQCNVGAWTDIIQVAAGGYHTVGLRSDGTVVAIGYDYHGQCDVGSWTNIIQVAAGGYHTVGIRSDGTAVAVGANWWGQCDVDGWDLS